MTFGQALDRVFRLLRAKLRLFVAISTIPAAAMAIFFVPVFVFVIVVVHPWSQPDPAKFAMPSAPFVLAMSIAEIVMLVTYALYEPAISYAALQADAGVKVSFRDAYRRAWSKFGRYLWLMILKWLIMAAPILLLALVIGTGAVLISIHSGGHADPSVVFLLAPLILVLYAVIGAYMIVALIWLAFSYPACIQEDLTAAASISRSIGLTKGARVRILLLGAVLYAISYAAFLVFECVFAFVGGLVAVAGLALHLQMNPWGFVGIGAAGIVLLTAMALWSTCSMAAYSTAFALVYRHHRLWREGVLPAPLPTQGLTA